MTTWREQISRELRNSKESWEDIESITLTDKELDRQFDAGYGATCGEPFTAWTKNRVYFPVCYDGAEWVASVARNPDKKPTEHIGCG